MLHLELAAASATEGSSATRSEVAVALAKNREVDLLAPCEAAIVPCQCKQGAGARQKLDDNVGMTVRV